MRKYFLLLDYLLVIRSARGTYISVEIVKDFNSVTQSPTKITKDRMSL